MTTEENEPREFASSPCYAHEFEDKLTNDQIIEALTELLEGERAGARIAKETRVEADKLEAAAPMIDLIEQIQRDEVRYCKLLIDAIESLGGHPSNETGAFYGKCMSISDLGERLAFLNRGQGWVSRKINEIVPQLRDNQLIADLKEMRQTHDVNIEKTNVTLAG